MKRVVLIGDSIRIGYQPVVERELADYAQVWAPQANGGTSSNLLRHLDEWILGREADLYHINCGLHDIKRLFGATENSVPLGEYEKNIEAILRRASARWPGRIVWATTTPVDQIRHHRRKSFDRFEADVLAYNRAAKRICRKLGIPVNDLFAAVQRAGPRVHLGQDGVHFTPRGYELLGQAVARFIRRKFASLAAPTRSAQHRGRFCTLVNCMDGRVQLPVITYLQKRFAAEYVDNVTEAGPNRILAEGRPASALQRILHRIRISLHKHGSTCIAIIGHWDCGANPQGKRGQVQQLRKAAALLHRTFPQTAVLPLWVDNEWRVTELAFTKRNASHTALWRTRTHH